MTDEIDTIGTVLRKNAEGFEKKDVATMATVGFVAAAFNFSLGGLDFWLRGVLSIGATLMFLAAVTIVGLSWQAQKTSRLSGQMLFGLFSAIMASNILLEFTVEAPSYMAIVMKFIVAGFILGKMYPGLDALKELTKENSAAKSSIVIVLSFLAGLLALAQFSLVIWAFL